MHSVEFNLYLNPTLVLLMFILFWIYGRWGSYGDVKKAASSKSYLKNKSNHDTNCILEMVVSCILVCVFNL